MNTNRKALYTIVLIAIVSMLLSACNAAPQGVSATYINMDSVARARVYTNCGAVEQNWILRDADQAAPTWDGGLQEWLDMEAEYQTCILSMEEAELAAASN